MQLLYKLCQEGCIITNQSINKQNESQDVVHEEGFLFVFKEKCSANAQVLDPFHLNSSIVNTLQHMQTEARLQIHIYVSQCGTSHR